MEWTPIFILGIIFGTVAFIASKRNKERMELIKHGEYHRVNAANLTPKTGSKALFLGLLCSGVGAALLISAILVQGLDRDMITGSLLTLFAGGAMLLYWKMTAEDRAESKRLVEEQLKMLTAERTTRPVEQDEAM